MENPRQLLREAEFGKDYQDWKNGMGKHVALRKVRELYESAMLGYPTRDCDIIQSPTYAMFILHVQDDWSPDFHRFLMDYWRERILQNGYYAYMSDLRSELLDGGLRKTIERHYLKPDVFEAMRNGDPVDRRFGNLTLELTFQGNDVDYFKLTMGFYHERSKKRELGLEKLMEILLKV